MYQYKHRNTWPRMILMKRKESSITRKTPPPPTRLPIKMILVSCLFLCPSLGTWKTFSTSTRTVLPSSFRKTWALLVSTTSQASSSALRKIYLTRASPVTKAKMHRTSPPSRFRMLQSPSSMPRLRENQLTSKQICSRSLKSSSFLTMIRTFLPSVPRSCPGKDWESSRRSPSRSDFLVSRSSYLPPSNLMRPYLTSRSRSPATPVRSQPRRPCQPNSKLGSCALRFRRVSCLQTDTPLLLTKLI